MGIDAYQPGMEQMAARMPSPNAEVAPDTEQTKPWNYAPSQKMVELLSYTGKFGVTEEGAREGLAHAKHVDAHQLPYSPSSFAESIRRLEGDFPLVQGIRQACSEIERNVMRWREEAVRSGDVNKFARFRDGYDVGYMLLLTAGDMLSYLERNTGTPKEREGEDKLADMLLKLNVLVEET